jgi:hypothetical protein
MTLLKLVTWIGSSMSSLFISTLVFSHSPSVKYQVLTLVFSPLKYQMSINNVTWNIVIWTSIDRLGALKWWFKWRHLLIFDLSIYFNICLLSSWSSINKCRHLTLRSTARRALNQSVKWLQTSTLEIWPLYLFQFLSSFIIRCQVSINDVTWTSIDRPSGVLNQIDVESTTLLKSWNLDTCPPLYLFQISPSLLQVTRFQHWRRFNIEIDPFGS